MLMLACRCLILQAAPVSTSVVVDFDDLPENQPVPTHYGGITWDIGYHGLGDHDGYAYVISSENGGRAKSQPNCMMNEWGVRYLNIIFDTPVIFLGAFFTRHGTVESRWPQFVGFVAFMDENDKYGRPAGALALSSSKPAWLACSYPGSVVKIQIQSTETTYGLGGWYDMDDLSYMPVPEAGAFTYLFTGLASFALLVKRRL